MTTKTKSPSAKAAKPAGAKKKTKGATLAKAKKSADPDENEDVPDTSDEDEEEEEKIFAAAVKSKKAPGDGKGADANLAVPAKRLTPEAKARINDLVKKGMSLGEALRAAGSWETFVAPVKDATPGVPRPFADDFRPPRRRGAEAEEEPFIDEEATGFVADDD